jgi:hypothetical protein
LFACRIGTDDIVMVMLRYGPLDRPTDRFSDDVLHDRLLLDESKGDDSADPCQRDHGNNRFDDSLHS